MTFAANRRGDINNRSRIADIAARKLEPNRPERYFADLSNVG